jgi:hypothetical protein
MMVNLSRLLNPKTNPAGYIAAAGAVYAAVAMIWNASHHHGVINPSVIISAVAAVASLLARQLVTPTADPKDGAGNPLVPAPKPPG